MKKIIAIFICILTVFGFSFNVSAEDLSEPEVPVYTTAAPTMSEIPAYKILNNVSLCFYVANSKAYVSYFAASKQNGINVTVKLYKGSLAIFSFASDEQSTNKKYISGLFTAPVDGFSSYRVEITVKSGNEKVTKKSSFDYNDNVFLGDVSGDGKVTAYDARMVLRHSAKLQKLNREQLKIADIDRNSKVNANDARYVLIIASGL